MLTNPLFGRKSSLTMVGADGREAREDTEIERQDFVATTSNKQLNFLQHVMTILAVNGRAAVVLPDNVLFKGGAGDGRGTDLLHGLPLCGFHNRVMEQGWEVESDADRVPWFAPPDRVDPFCRSVRGGNLAHGRAA